MNPRRDEVMGVPCVPSVAELPVAVDALVVAIPAAGVPEVIEQAGARGCGGAVVISAGFGEVAEGVELQPRAARRRGAVRAAGVRAQLQRDRVAAQPHLAVGRRARRARARAGGAHLPERQRGSQRARDAPRVALSHGRRERQPGGRVGSRLPRVPGRRARRRGRSRCISRTTAARGCARGWRRAREAGVPVVVLKVGSSVAGRAGGGRSQRARWPATSGCFAA